MFSTRSAVPHVTATTTRYESYKRAEQVTKERHATVRKGEISRVCIFERNITHIIHHGMMSPQTHVVRMRHEPRRFFLLLLLTFCLLHLHSCLQFDKASCHNIPFCHFSESAGVTYCENILIHHPRLSEPQKTVGHTLCGNIFFIQ
jgi:hypothetical protein